MRPARDTVLVIQHETFNIGDLPSEVLINDTASDSLVPP